MGGRGCGCIPGRGCIPGLNLQLVNESFDKSPISPNKGSRTR